MFSQPPKHGDEDELLAPPRTLLPPRALQLQRCLPCTSATYVEGTPLDLEHVPEAPLNSAKATRPLHE